MIKDLDTVISTRVRFARNLKDYPYTNRLDENGAKEIIERIENALGDKYIKTDMTSVSLSHAMSLVEKHIISREFAKSNLPRALFTKDDVKLMVCEEDHIRLQVIKIGFAIDECFSDALECDNKLLSKLNIDYSEALGYLTQCPTNLGTAMRVSVMMFIPGICLSSKLKALVSQLDKLGITIRGMYGEGSESGACIYQISNRETLGVKEEKVIEKIRDIVLQITDIERKARNELFKKGGISLEDKISRAMGTLNYAKCISSKEFCELYALVRMKGEYDLEKLDSLFCNVMPYSLCEHYEKTLNETQRDIARAEYIQKNI